MKSLFSQVITFWKSTTARVATHAFVKAVVKQGPPGVGWLTYVADPRASPLRDDGSLRSLMFEEMPDGGLLISLGRTLISPDNMLQVEKARLLRSKLVAEQFIVV